MYTVFVTRRDDDLSALIELGHVTDSVLKRAVAAHVVNHPPTDHDYSISGLFDPSDNPQAVMVGYDLIVNRHFERLPIAVKVRCALGAGFPATNEDRGRPFGPATGG